MIPSENIPEFCSCGTLNNLQLMSIGSNKDMGVYIYLGDCETCGKTLRRERREWKV